MLTKTYRLTGLEAIDPAALPFGEGIAVTIAATWNSRGPGSGLDVTLEASDRGRLIAYIRDNWGDDELSYRYDDIRESVENPELDPAGQALDAAIRDAQDELGRSIDGDAESGPHFSESHDGPMVAHLEDLKHAYLLTTGEPWSHA